MISSELISLIQQSKRPVFIWGAGMRPYRGQALALARSLGIPVATTWGAIDLMHHDDPLMCGGFGTHGTRAANFAVANSDLIISIGSRLDTKATGIPSHFARAASIVYVDIDRAEIEKFEKLGLHIAVGIEADAGEFIAALGEHTYMPICFEDWIERIAQWKRKYAQSTLDVPGINPYQLMKELGTYTTADDIICSDTGCALGWLMQGFPFKGERFIHAFNMTPMGYGLPAAIGSHFATGKRVILVCGDGSIMMSLPELATVRRWDLPIKIILLNNQGHAMCRQTQRQWLGGTYPATSIEGGLGFPAWQETAAAFLGMGMKINKTSDLSMLFSNSNCKFCVVPIHPDAGLEPQAKYGQPIEDGDPQLPRDEFRAQMIVEPL